MNIKGDVKSLEAVGVGLVLAGLPEPRVVFPPTSEPDALFAALRDAKPATPSSL